MIFDLADWRYKNLDAGILKGSYLSKALQSDLLNLLALNVLQGRKKVVPKFLMEDFVSYNISKNCQ